MNSCRVSVKVKTTVEMMPGSDKGRTTRKKSFDAVVAIDQRRFFQFGRHGFEESAEQPHAEGHGERGIDDDERPGRVFQTEHDDDAKHGDEEQGGRHEINQEHQDAGAFAPAPGQTRQGIGRGQRQQQGDDDDGDAHQHRVLDEGDIVRVAKERLDMLQRRLLPEDKGLRTPIQIAIDFETVQEHDEEGGDGEEAEYQDDHVKGRAAQNVREFGFGRAIFVKAPGDAQRDQQNEADDQQRPEVLKNPDEDAHQRTSARLAVRSIKSASAKSRGKANSAIAAPCAKLPPSMPIWKAYKPMMRV